MQKLLLVLTGLLVLSCSAESPSTEEAKAGKDELIDIRVFPEGEIRLNGTMISESSLSSHIESLSTTKKTRARVIFDERKFPMKAPLYISMCML